jgi:hypothetical protein
MSHKHSQNAATQAKKHWNAKHYAVIKVSADTDVAAAFKAACAAAGVSMNGELTQFMAAYCSAGKKHRQTPDYSTRRRRHAAIRSIAHVDLDLRNMLREELNILKEYEKMLGSMTAAEKKELREWMAHGRSVNSNPYMLYGENGCLLDLISATRIDDDMMRNPEDYGAVSNLNCRSDCSNDEEMPF